MIVTSLAVSIQKLQSLALSCVDTQRLSDYSQCMSIKKRSFYDRYFCK